MKRAWGKWLVVWWVAPFGLTLLLVQVLKTRWLWHPLGYCPYHGATLTACRSYNFWSGIGSDIQEAAVIGALVTAPLAVRRFLHAHFECHEETCRKLGFHHVERTPYRTCWKHHPVLSVHPKHGVPLHHIHRSR